jgi:hypothetical protein
VGAPPAGAFVRACAPIPRRDAREVEAPVAERLDEVRESLDEGRGGHPVVGGSLRPPELAREEIEERAITEIDPPPVSIEGGEGNQELRERAVLAAEEVGEAEGLFAGGGHERRVSRPSEASWDARIRVLARDLGAPSRTPPGVPRRSRRACRRLLGGLGARPTPWKRDSTLNASTAPLGCGILSFTYGEGRLHRALRLHALPAAPLPGPLPASRGEGEQAVT